MVDLIATGIDALSIVLVAATLIAATPVSVVDRNTLLYVFDFALCVIAGVGLKACYRAGLGPFQRGHGTPISARRPSLHPFRFKYKDLQDHGIV